MINEASNYNMTADYAVPWLSPVGRVVILLILILITGIIGSIH